MQSKKLGVIGGMGPMATSLFLEKLITNTAADKDQDHIDTIILNHASMPDRTEAIINQTGQKFLEAVKKDIQLLEYAGVENIAIPCNTSHYYHEEMQAMTSIPIIHMVEKTVEHLNKKYGNHCKIAVLATDGTIKSGIYAKAIEKFNMEAYFPDPILQETVMDIIYQYKAGIVCEDKLKEVIHQCLAVEKVTCIILGCTELSCINIAEEQRKYCVDSMDMLVEQSILLSGKKMLKPLSLSTDV